MTIPEAIGWYLGAALVVLFGAVVFGAAMGIIVRMTLWVAGVQE